MSVFSDLGKLGTFRWIRQSRKLAKKRSLSLMMGPPSWALASENRLTPAPEVMPCSRRSGVMLSLTMLSFS